MSDNKNLQRFFVFFSSAFSGGYKIYAVFLVAIFFSSDVVQNFNIYYFVVVMCVSLGVLPISALMTSKDIKLNGSGKFVWLMIFSFVSLCLAYAFRDNLRIDSSINLFLTLLTAIVFTGGYEISRRELANSSDFKRIFFAGCASTLLFLSAFFINKIPMDKAEFLILAMALCFGIPVFNQIFLKQKNSFFFGGLTRREFFARYFSSFVSNSSSTLISYLLPLCLVSLLGASVSPYLAVIFSLASLFMLLPRYMAEKNIVHMRNGGDSLNIANRSYTLTVMYVIFVSVVAFVVFYFSQIADYLLYLLLFSSLQLTQLNLPYSNILMVEGRLNVLLKFNLIGAFPFLVIVPIYMLGVSGVDLCYWLVSLYCAGSVVKLALVRAYCFSNFVWKNET